MLHYACLFPLPPQHLYVYLSDRSPRTLNYVLCKHTNPQIKEKEMMTATTKLLTQLGTNDNIKTYLKPLLDIPDEFAWIDAQHWSIPGQSVQDQAFNKQYLDSAMQSLRSFAHVAQNPPDLRAAGGSLGCQIDAHDLRMLSCVDKWNDDDILERCLAIFSQMDTRRDCRSRAIFPDPQYSVHGREARERRRMYKLGRDFKGFPATALGNLFAAAKLGHFELFQEMAACLGGAVDYNRLFTGESEFPLLYFLMSGHRDLARGRLGISCSEPYEPAHLNLAQHLLDRGLDVNIQNAFGYTALNEAVINIPDITFARFLLRNGADPNIYNIFCSTPLHESAVNINVECVKLLCQYGADPRLLNFQAYRVLDMSSARRHIETYTMLCNQARKLREQRSSLEHEDTSYCFVCSVSNKDSSVSLRRCARCSGAERYCSRKCQKFDWSRHKSICSGNRMRVSTKMDSEVKRKQIALAVEYWKVNLYPSWKVQNALTSGTKAVEYNMSYASDMHTAHLSHEPHHQKYRQRKKKEAIKQYQSHLKDSLEGKALIKTLYPPCGVNRKFVVKIQVFPANNAYMLCYDKSREYQVRIFRPKQRKKYDKLFRIVVENGIETRNAKNGYLYACVDKKKILHVFVDDLVAAQPW